MIWTGLRETVVGPGVSIRTFPHELGPGNNRAMSSAPGEKLPINEIDEEELSKQDTRANYQAQYRSDIQCAVKELASYPCKYHTLPLELAVWTDAGYAGCKNSRAPTCQGVVPSGERIAKSRSHAQSVIALSSREAEYYGMFRGGSVGLGPQAVLTDVDVPTQFAIKSDATAAISIANLRFRNSSTH
eukprot:9170577-Pyramimonas_sp.AAC.1